MCDFLHLTELRGFFISVIKPILRRSVVSGEYDNVRSIRRVPSVYKVHYNNGESGM